MNSSSSTSRNRLRGELRQAHLQYMWWGVEESRAYGPVLGFQPLLLLKLAANGFGGALPAALPPRLLMLDAGSNRLAGAIPDSYGTLYILDVHNNTQLAGPPAAANRPNNDQAYYLHPTM